jgi:signal peptidase II
VLFWLTGVFITGLDVFSKHLVRTNIDPGQSLMPGSFFQIVHYQNSGGAFGIFENLTPVLAVFSAIIAACALFLYASRKVEVFNSGWGRFTLGLVLGGAVGNLIDRITRGYVTDFIRVDGFAAFNVADSAVTVSVFLIAWLALSREVKKT